MVSGLAQTQNDPTGRVLNQSLASFQYTSESSRRPRRRDRGSFDICPPKRGASHPSVREVAFVKKRGTESWQAAEGVIKEGTHVSRLERSPGETRLNQKPAAGIRSSSDPTTVFKCEGLMSVCLC